MERQRREEEEEEDNAKGSSGPGSIIKNFCETTSTHALPAIARSETLSNRIFWSISFLIFTGVMIYMIIAAILSYLSYPTTMNTNVEHEWPQNFPAFSFCNACGFRLDLFLDPFLNYTRSKNSSTSNDPSRWTSNDGSLIRSFVIDGTNQNETFDRFLFSLPVLLYRCRFNGEACFTNEFLSFDSSLYGRCFTFNAKMKNLPNDGIRFSHLYGGKGELILEFYIHRHQYVPWIGDGMGIVALVHDNDELPSIESAGILLSPGRKHKLGYRKRSMQFLSSPYTTCTDRINRPMEIMFEKSYQNADYKYSQTICLTLCEQAFIYDQCGCVDPTQWNARALILPHNDQIIHAPLCQRNDRCFRNASNILFSSKELMKTYCSDCSRPCSTTAYSVQVSSYQSPMSWQMQTIRNFVENLSLPLAENWSSQWSELIHQNYLSVSVLRETSIVQSNTQTAAQGPVDLLSNIGGQTGLWIGMSFLSLIEIFEMIYRLIRYQVDRLRPRVSQQEQHPNPN